MIKNNIQKCVFFFLFFISVLIIGTQTYQTILLQVQTLDQAQPTGSWATPTEAGLRTWSCLGRNDSIISEDNSDKTLGSAVFDWTPPALDVGKVQFR